MKCYLCGGTSLRTEKKIIIRQAVISELVYCRDCELGFLSPQPSGAVLNDCYSYQYSNEMLPVDDSSRLGKERALADSALPRYERYLSLLKTTTGGKEKLSILDYGCGMGHFLNLAKRHGYIPNGLDISTEAVSFARNEYGLNDVYPLAEKNIGDYAADTFDIISMFHVIEHMPDPLDFLKHYIRLVKPGGIIIIAAPNHKTLFELILKCMRKIKYMFYGERVYAADYARRSFKSGCEIAQPIDNNDARLVAEFKLRNFHHLFYFTSRSLRELLLKAGFEIIGGAEGYVIPGTSFINKIIKNSVVNHILAIFDRQEELLLVARKPIPQIMK
ncbi:MAG: class I SAM-dependent methyltransferase [Candidatus Omnitrophica bacterium]|nr:class I SAM-dependent methyltransferase [Candidatus Omnitrophota bacterium]